MATFAKDIERIAEHYAELVGALSRIEQIAREALGEEADR